MGTGGRETTSTLFTERWAGLITDPDEPPLKGVGEGGPPLVFGLSVYKRNCSWREKPTDIFHSIKFSVASCHSTLHTSIIWPARHRAQLFTGRRAEARVWGPQGCGQQTHWNPWGPGEGWGGSGSEV